MYKGKRILTVIPARGGSKGIPLKNLRSIGGRSLMEWALFAACRCRIVDRTIVSSDCRSIIRRANRHGDYAPFIRPTELARDTSGSMPVFRHALEWAEKEDSCRYDIVVALEPTCPFRLPKHIEEGVRLAVQSKASSIMSLVQVSDHHPVRIKRLRQNGRIEPFCMPEPEGLRRQDQEPAYIRNCAVLVFARKTMMANRLWGDKPFGFKMDSRLYGINIDEFTDLLTARAFYGHIKTSGNLKYIDPALG